MSNLTKRDVLYLLQVMFAAKEALKFDFTKGLQHQGVEEKLSDMLELASTTDEDLDKSVQEYVDNLPGLNETEEFEETEEVELDLKDVELIEEDPDVFVPSRDLLPTFPMGPTIRKAILVQLPKVSVGKYGKLSKAWFIDRGYGPSIINFVDSPTSNGHYVTHVTRTTKGLSFVDGGAKYEFKVAKFPKMWTKTLKLGIKYSVVP